MDHFLDAKDAKKAVGSFREAQMRSLILLKECIKICDKNNLNY